MTETLTTAGLEPSPEFEAWVAGLDPKHWAKHDLSACRLGWEAGRSSLATELLALRKRVGELEGAIGDTVEIAGVSATDRGYHQRIEKIEGSSMYVRIDTGPDLEEAWLCVDDGEPDTHHVAKFVSLSYADAFINWNRRPALTAYEAAKGGEGWSVEPVISCPRCGGVGFIAPKGIEQLPELYEVSEEPF